MPLNNIPPVSRDVSVMLIVMNLIDVCNFGESHKHRLQGIDRLVDPDNVKGHNSANCFELA